VTPSPAAFRQFRDDHRRVLGELDRLEGAVLQGAHRGRLGPRALAAAEGAAAFLLQQFATHMAVEEDVLYPALAEAFPEARPSLRPLQVEHAELRSMLTRLAGLLREPQEAARDEQITVQVRDLIDLLRLHVHKEDAAVFTVAARVLTPREIGRLAARVAAHRESHSRRRPRRAGAKGSRR
jgi:hemerythrin-like domain-containing protein